MHYYFADVIVNSVLIPVISLIRRWGPLVHVMKLQQDKKNMGSNLNYYYYYDSLNNEDTLYYISMKILLLSLTHCKIKIADRLIYETMSWNIEN